MSQILNNAKLLRNNLTVAVQRLWYYSRANRFLNLKFKRQKPIGAYIVDFVCVEQKLIIEVDGGQHAEDVAYDDRRTNFLRGESYHVLRFWNNQVLEEIDSELEAIRVKTTLSTAPLLSPSPAGGRGAIAYNARHDKKLSR